MQYMPVKLNKNCLVCAIGEIINCFFCFPLPPTVIAYLYHQLSLLTFTTSCHCLPLPPAVISYLYHQLSLLTLTTSCHFLPLPPPVIAYPYHRLSLLTFTTSCHCLPLPQLTLLPAGIWTSFRASIYL